MSQAGSQPDVIVVGGGLAGISAAAGLADAGLAVTVLEGRPWLGGATCSFARRGLTIDNGQHAVLRGFAAYRDLLARLGVSALAEIQDRLDLTVLAPGGADVRLLGCGLPAPLHLARALAGYRLLTPSERASAAVAGAMLRVLRPGSDRGEATFGSWLRRRGQGDNARQYLWDLLCGVATGLPADEADLGQAAAAIRALLLSSSGAADLAVPSVPLSQLHAAPAAGLLRQLGVTVLLGARVTRIAAGGGDYEVWIDRDAAGPGEAPGVSEPGVSEPGASEAPGVREARGSAAAPGTGPAAASRAAVATHEAGSIRAAGIVLAVPAWEAAAIAPPQLADQAAHWARLQPSPVVSLHVIYGERVTGLPYAASAGSPIRWVVDKTGPAGLHAGQYLAAAVPAADRYVDLPASRLRAELLPELAQLFPAAADTSVHDFFVTRERRARVRQVPGSGELRVVPPGTLPGFAVAGAWSDSNWPDTMEGAVRSGRAAAVRLVADFAGGDPAAAGADTAGAAGAADSEIPSLARAL